MNKDPIRTQREYYKNTAKDYDSAHHSETDGHSLALSFMLSTIDLLKIESVLDVGTGTGRALLGIKQGGRRVRAVGVEPSAELRDIGYSKGLTSEELVDGDATKLAYADGSFDLVCEFGMLHHVPNPSVVVGEMLRVARKAIFISDSNNFGQGRALARFVKQSLHRLRLWPLADKIKTRGKGYSISEGDGLFYSYSVFSDYEQISRTCKSVHLLNTLEAKPNLYRTAPQVALLGIKKEA